MFLEKKLVDSVGEFCSWRDELVVLCCREKVLVQMVSIFWRSCFSRSNSDGRQEASGKRSLFEVEAGTLAYIRAANLMTFVYSAKGPLW